LDKIKLPVPKNVLILFILGIGLLVLGNVMASQRATPTAAVLSTPGPAKADALPDDAAALKSYRDSLALEAERVIGKVRGAGKVLVSVALSSGPETLLAGNQNRSVRHTEEKEQGGVSRVIEETSDSAQPVIARQSSGDHPLVTRIAAPQVEGVIVVASGAADPRVRAEVTRAAQVLFNVPAHRVRVLPMEGR